MFKKINCINVMLDFLSVSISTSFLLFQDSTQVVHCSLSLSLYLFRFTWSLRMLRSWVENSTFLNSGKGKASKFGFESEMESEGEAGDSVEDFPHFVNSSSSQLWNSNSNSTPLDLTQERKRSRGRSQKGRTRESCDESVQSDLWIKYLFSDSESVPTQLYLRAMNFNDFWSSNGQGQGQGQIQLQLQGQGQGRGRTQETESSETESELSSGNLEARQKRYQRRTYRNYRRAVKYRECFIRSRLHRFEMRHQVLKAQVKKLEEEKRNLIFDLES